MKNRVKHLLISAITLCCASAQADPITLASHHPATNLVSWYTLQTGQFNSGGFLYDIKHAQTFTPTNSGYVQSVSVTAVRQVPVTNASLRLRITSLSGDAPDTNATIASCHVHYSKVPISFFGAPQPNVTGTFTTVTGELYASTARLEAGTTYGLVIDTDLPEAKYNVSRLTTDGYAGGKPFKGYDSDTWTELSAGDFFFEVRAQPLSVITNMTMNEGTMQFEGQNGNGIMYVEQSSSLSGWTNAAGTITTGMPAWSVSITPTSHVNYRIRHE